MARPPLGLFGLAIALAAAGALVAGVWGGALVAAAVGWSLAGPVAIGVLACLHPRRHPSPHRCGVLGTELDRCGVLGGRCGVPERNRHRCMASRAVGRKAVGAMGVLRRGLLCRGAAGALLMMLGFPFPQRARRQRRRGQALRRLPGRAEERRPAAALRRVQQPAVDRRQGGAGVGREVSRPDTGQTTPTALAPIWMSRSPASRTPMRCTRIGPS